MPASPAPPGDRKTVSRRGEKREPRLPHERDESSDSQRSGPGRHVVEQAAEDVAAGRVDTDKGPVLDEAYQRQKKPA